MLLNTYESQSLLTNVSVKGATSEADTEAFRGDLVIIEGDIADDAGRRLPPVAVVKQSTMLIKGDKQIMQVGCLIDLAHAPDFFAKYKDDLTADTKVMFYVENITKPLVVEFEGIKTILVPHEEGAIWNTLMEDLRLDKSDFKGQSAEDKLLTMLEGLNDYTPEGETVSFEEAQAFISTVKREHRGPV